MPEEIYEVVHTSRLAATGEFDTERLIENRDQLLYRMFNS